MGARRGEEELRRWGDGGNVGGRSNSMVMLLFLLLLSWASRLSTCELPPSVGFKMD
jgi:hypothetical protein